MLSLHSVSWLLVLVRISTVKGNFDCPRFCTCQSTTNIECDGSGIDISELEKVFLSLPKEAVALTVRNSQLKSLQTSFFSRVLPNLKELKLEYNPLENVPQNLSGVFPSLQNLFLQSNQIQSVREADFAGLTKLQKLRLDRNELTTIEPNTFKATSMLTELFLESNNINEISPDGFNGLKELTVLVLDKNKIITLPQGVFREFQDSSLQIDLKDNEIEKLPDGLFRNGQNLNVLTLDSNKITEIADDAFKGITIVAISLSNNKIRDLNPKVLSGLKAFTTINAIANPIDCNCNIAKILKAHHPKPIIASCATPEDMKDTQLSNIRLAGIEEKLKCTICDLNDTCVNNGKCVVISKSELRCECPPTHEGVKCETEITTTTTTLAPQPTTKNITAAPPVLSTSSEKKDNTTLYIIIAVVVLVILVIGAIIICCCLRKRKEKNTEESQMLEDSNPTNV